MRCPARGALQYTAYVQRQTAGAGEGRLTLAILAHGLVRIASSATGVVLGVWLASMSRTGAAIQPSLVGALGASSFASELVGSVPLGIAADAVSVRWLMSTGALAGALSTLLMAAALPRPLLFASRVFEGFGVAAVTPALLSCLARRTVNDRRERARLMSWFELSLLAGLALGGLLATQLWVHAHRGAFVSLALLYGLCAALLLASVPRGPAAGGRAALNGVRGALRDPLVRRLAPVWLCVNAIVGLWLGPTLSFVLTERQRAGQLLDGVFVAAPTAIGWLLLIYTALFGVGVTLWSRRLPRIGARRAMSVALAAMLAVCGVLALLNHSGSWPQWTRWLLGTAAALLIMIESGFGPAALTWLGEALGRQAGAGAAMGLYSMLLSLGALGGALLAGWAATLWRFDGLLAATVLLAACGLVLLARLPAADADGFGDARTIGSGAQPRS